MALLGQAEAEALSRARGDSVGSVGQGERSFSDFEKQLPRTWMRTSLHASMTTIHGMSVWYQNATSASIFPQCIEVTVLGLTMKSSIVSSDTSLATYGPRPL